MDIDCNIHNQKCDELAAYRGTRSWRRSDGLNYLNKYDNGVEAIMHTFDGVDILVASFVKWVVYMVRLKTYQPKRRPTW